MKVLIHCALDAASSDDRKEAWLLCGQFIERVKTREAALANICTLLSYCIAPGEIDASYTLEILAKKADLCVAFCGKGSAGFGTPTFGLGAYLSRSDTPTLAIYESWEDIGRPAYFLPKLTSAHVWRDGEEIVPIFERAIRQFQRTRALMMGLPVMD